MEAVSENYSTRIESYYANTTISSHFARIDITVDFLNNGDCKNLYGFTVQLPINSQVAKIWMNLSGRCELISNVTTEEEATAKFDTAASRDELSIEHLF